jgi:hypothetical protein
MTRDAETWTQRSLEATRARIDGEWVLGKLPTPARDLAVMAVDELSAPAVADAVARIGEERWRGALARLHDGRHRDAIDYLDLSFDERRALMQAATMSEFAALAQRQRDAETVRAALLEIGAKALRIAVPLLIASL